MADEKSKEVQEKLLIFQILQNQLEELSKQGAALEARMSELELTGNALKEIEKSYPGAETLVPLGGGCFVHSRLAGKEKFIVEVGGGVMAEKTLQEASAIIGERKKEVENVNKNLQGEIQKLTVSINLLTLDLQKTMGKETKAEKAKHDEGSDSGDIIVD